MPSRLPTSADLSPETVLSITPPATGKPVNVLILLHGLGDTHLSLKTLGERLSLPETVCISLQSPTPLPFELPGFHWGDDMIFDQSSGDIDPDSGFTRASKVLNDMLQRLMDRCGYQARDLLFYGFGQGGMLALKIAAEMQEIGGVVSIGGPLPSDIQTTKEKSKTPIIVLGGSSESAITDSSITKLKNAFEFVEYKKWRRPGDGAPRDRDEMLPIMQFLARRLRSRHGVPEGAVELT